MSEPLLDPTDELGQEDALEPPDGDFDDDPYVEDPDYDEANDDLDPDSVSEGLGVTGSEVPSEGGDI
jgi:hypothetical protein